MTDLRTAAQQALEALERSETTVQYEGFGMARREAERKHQAAITALRAALAEPVLAPAPGYCKHCKQYTIEEPLPAEPVQEPVADQFADVSKKVQEPVALAWSNLEGTKFVGNGEKWKHKGCVVPLYTAPPQRKPLTEEEIDSIWDSEKAFADIYAIARAIERAHGIAP